MITKTIQFIEPDRQQAQQVIQVLEQAGYQVDYLTSGKAGLQSRQAAITLVSSSLPDMSLTEWVRYSQTVADTQQRRIAIAIVDQHEGLLAAEAMKAGATDYLLKPFEPSQLLSLIARVEALAETHV